MSKINKEKINYKLFSTFLFILLGCHTQKAVDFLSARESLKLRLLPNNKFEFDYYKLAGMSFENSKRNFCVGEYKVVSKNEYELFPNKLDTNSIATQDSLSEFNKNKKLHLIFNTGIRAFEETKGYSIIVYYNSGHFLVHGTGLDTVLSQDIGSRIRFEIDLADYYVKARPAPFFTKLLTSYIDIADAKMVIIYAPITQAYFYYFDPGIMQIRENRKYYYLDNRKIRKEL